MGRQIARSSPVPQPLRQSGVFAKFIRYRQYQRQTACRHNAGDFCPSSNMARSASLLESPSQSHCDRPDGTCARKPRRTGGQAPNRRAYRGCILTNDGPPFALQNRPNLNWDTHQIHSFSHSSGERPAPLGVCLDAPNIGKETHNDQPACAQPFCRSSTKRCPARQHSAPGRNAPSRSLSRSDA